MFILLQFYFTFIAVVQTA